MSMRSRPLGQQGITIFEISIITLIILLVAISTWVIVSKINSSSQKNYNNYNNVRSINPSEN